MLTIGASWRGRVGVVKEQLREPCSQRGFDRCTGCVGCKVPNARTIRTASTSDVSAAQQATVSAQFRRDQRPELDHPAPDRLTAVLDPALRHQPLDVADAEREPEMPAHCLRDDRCWELVMLETDRANPASWP